MSDDLVKQLRDGRIQHSVMGPVVMTEAADAIEQLSSRLKDAREVALRAEAEAARLREALVAFNEHFGPLADNVMLHEGARNCFRLARSALRGEEG